MIICRKDDNGYYNNFRRLTKANYFSLILPQLGFNKIP